VLSYEETPIPEIADDEVLIQVVATSVNPVDWKVREGYLQKHLPHELPLTLGWDVSGYIAAVGKHVSQFHKGDEVYTHPTLTRDGSYAEYICVSASHVAPKPRGITHKEAASLPLTGIAAWKALIEIGQLQNGQNLLIHGASGGVGSLAVQIAKAKDMYVFGTTSRNMELLEDLGVDSIINYESENFYDKVANVDCVLDTIGGETQEKSWSVLGYNGILVSLISLPSPGNSEARRFRHAYVSIEPDAGALQEITTLVEQEMLRPVVGHEYSLQTIQEAHRVSRSGHACGKIVIPVASAFP
jgi:NADPH:quinone reductase-like Zn-dependent oxidoreductase